MLEDLNFVMVKRKLDELESNSEKLNYLTEVNFAIERIIKCFRDYHFYNLRNLVSNNIIIDGDCPEFKNFIKKILLENSTGRDDRRSYNNDKIFHAVKNKIDTLEKVKSYVEGELDLYIKLETLKEKKNSEASQKKNDFKDETAETIKNELDQLKFTEFLTDISPDETINQFPKQEKKVEVNSYSSRSEIAVPKYRWKGETEELLSLFKLLYDLGIIPRMLYEKKESIIKDYFEIVKLTDENEFRLIQTSEPKETLPKVNYSFLNNFL